MHGFEAHLPGPVVPVGELDCPEPSRLRLLDDAGLAQVIGGDGRTLVPLINDSTSEITPAYSYEEAAALLAEAAEEGVDVASETLRRDVLNRSVERAPKGRKGRKDQSGRAPANKAAKSKETATQARRHAAVERSANNPLPPRFPTLGHPPLGSPQPSSMAWSVSRTSTAGRTCATCAWVTQPTMAR
ncbi:hypothetical protein [Ottowia sp.]|jgi:hypothetical protein|uniref:hypothetical protein n=1 Tax=Ottowia sp. TaxID=1898956 RepID=UPI0025E1DE05|nr:hypothetical protein [Ottowia sp.]MBK6615006.1 hypothetical protein [Ottowia sp.]MBK6746086.1 hypothetical protein [Ottowia sp.]